MFFPVYQAIRACHALFNEVYVAVYYSGLYKQALPGKVMRGKVLAQSLKGFLGNGVIAPHLIVYVLHGVVVGGAHSNNLLFSVFSMGSDKYIKNIPYRHS